MADKKVMLTEDGYNKLVEKLNYLKSVRRIEVAERLKAAIALGDLSENSEYDDAKNEFEALKTKLNHNLSKELDKNRNIIQHLIEQDIVTAYYFQRGSVASAIQYDKQVKKAVETLNTHK